MSCLIDINNEKFSLLLYLINAAQLDDKEFDILFKPPCELYIPIEELISPGNKRKNSPKIPQNAFILYLKNYRKTPGSPNKFGDASKEAGYAWNKKESDDVRKYFKLLEKLAVEKY